MDPIPERRRARRVVVGAEHTIRFEAGGMAYRGVRIANVSRTGCFAMVGHGETSHLREGMLLERMAFEHPDLPLEPFGAEIMYILGEPGDEALEYVGVGIHFAELEEAEAALLEDFLAASLVTP